MKAAPVYRRQPAERIPRLPPVPPDYGEGQACAICWEPFSRGFIDRWLHRRKWGHNPELINRPSPESRHDRNVRLAAEWREWRAGRRWPGEVCKNCGQDSMVGFHVPDAVWQAVTEGGQGNTWCVGCFTRVAESAGIQWANDIQFFVASYLPPAESDAPRCGGTSAVSISPIVDESSYVKCSGCLDCAAEAFRRAALTDNSGIPDAEGCTCGDAPVPRPCGSNCKFPLD
jgi:hypothetical protein